MTLLAIGILLRTIFVPTRHPIEGLWQSRWYTDCAFCDSYSFLLFRDGKIVGYSDRHLTEYAAGIYEDLGSGHYKVTMTPTGATPLQWIVHPGADSWTPPPTELKEWFRSGRQFKRLVLGVREETIIKEAPDRDERFRAIIEKRKADKATKETNKKANP